MNLNTVTSQLSEHNDDTTESYIIGTKETKTMLVSLYTDVTNLE